MKVSSATYVKTYGLLSKYMAKVPIIDRYDFLHDRKDGFDVNLIFKDKTTALPSVTVLSRSYPSIIANLKDEEQNQKSDYKIIIAPYISKESAKVCEQLDFGYIELQIVNPLHVHQRPRTFKQVSQKTHCQKYIRSIL
ncbi:MAG: hypothetical protein WCY53_06320 [Sphaerochaetaceae bacterium]